MMYMTTSRNCFELSEKTKREIKQARQDIKDGNFYTLEQIIEEMKINKKG